MSDEKAVTIKELSRLKTNLSADLERLVHMFKAKTGKYVDEVQHGRSHPDTHVAVKGSLP